MRAEEDKVGTMCAAGGRSSWSLLTLANLLAVSRVDTDLTAAWLEKRMPPRVTHDPSF